MIHSIVHRWQQWMIFFSQLYPHFMRGRHIIVGTDEASRSDTVQAKNGNAMFFEDEEKRRLFQDMIIFSFIEI